MKKLVFFSFLLAMATACAQTTPNVIGSTADANREFRGAWMHIIGQKQYAAMGTDECQAYLTGQLDLLQQAGCNAVIWQVRPQADAAYVSDLEPWSKWLTGEAGKAPTPLWDPLQFMVEQAHRRGMELHAWINPYRVTSSDDDMPAPGHVYYEHPEWFVKYADGKIYFDPGLPESRDFIDRVVRDIITRYDVDAIHMDDYFYPYPVAGAEFPDTASYDRYGIGWDLGDWRRHNVDLLIEQLHNSIVEVKPWVRFGISPFGIWRNLSSDPDGSNTNGLQCYDGLYADCPKWTREGWVDYMVPQLYWELENKRASDLTLMMWWNDHANDRHMYYGQSVNNVMNHRDIAEADGDTLNPTQLDHKIRLQRALPHVHGVTWWPAYSITGNFKGVLDSLATHHQSHPALIPAYTWIDDVAPNAVADLKVKKINGCKHLTWSAPPTSDPLQQAVRYGVYRFDRKADVSLDAPGALIAITADTAFELPRDKGKWTYVITVLDRCWNQSVPTTIRP